MTVLEECLIILSKIGSDLNKRTRMLNQQQLFSIVDGEDKICLWITLSSMNILDINSFRDEYNNYFGIKTEPEYKDRILAVKRICKPILKEIDKWKDLRSYRNDFIAHNFRSADNKMFYNRKEIEYNVPGDTMELELSTNYILLICLVILAEFDYESKQVTESDLGELKRKEIRSKSEIDLQTIKIIELVKKNCDLNGREFKVDFERLNEIKFNTYAP